MPGVVMCDGNRPVGVVGGGCNCLEVVITPLKLSCLSVAHWRTKAEDHHFFVAELSLESSLIILRLVFSVSRTCYLGSVWAAGRLQARVGTRLYHPIR